MSAVRFLPISTKNIYYSYFDPFFCNITFKKSSRRKYVQNKCMTGFDEALSSLLSNRLSTPPKYTDNKALSTVSAYFVATYLQLLLLKSFTVWHISGSSFQQLTVSYVFTIYNLCITSVTTSTIVGY